jgi:2-polyprenyl-6-methoxyphenol hydroxylase-like FAD-dependent oxidoreductase
MSSVDTDVVIVGAAPTGLTLATELCLAGLRPVVLDRLPEIRTVAKAGGLGGRILDVLRYRDLGDVVAAAATGPAPTPRFPFGGIHVDLSGLPESPMNALPLPQPEMERALGDHARAAGADVRRGHELSGLHQDDDRVTVEIQGPDGPYRLTARYLVGCDGIHSRVREWAGIPFPAITYPEVQRLGSTTMPAGVTLRADGDYDVVGHGRLRSGYQQTARGIFAVASYTPDDLGLYTSEIADGTADQDASEMTLEELRASIRRVLGIDLPLGEPTRLTRFVYGAGNARRYRQGRILLAGDAAHRFPTGGVAVNAGMLDAVNLGWKLAAAIAGWAPDGLLDTYHDERHHAGERTLLHAQAQVALRRGHDAAAEALRAVFGELLLDDQTLQRVGAMIAGADVRYPTPGAPSHPLAGGFAPAAVPTTLLRDGRPVLLDFAGRPDLPAVAEPWRDRVDVHTATVADPPADALLLRPDGYVAWAAGPDSTATGLAHALSYWFGEPR